MGAPAVSPAPRRARAATKPRRATPRPAPRPKARSTAKPKSRAAGAAAKPKPRSAAKSRTNAAASRRKSASAAPRRTQPVSRPRGAVANAGGVVMFPVAAVSGIADSGLIERMTRGRLWIGLLAVLLGGIVALNVWGLGMSAATSSTEARIDALQQDNGVLGARTAEMLSTEEIQKQAAALGLSIPAPDAIHYLDSNDSDAAKAAKRLASGEIVVGDPAVQGEGADDALPDPAVTTTTTDPATAPTTTTTDPTVTATTADPIIDPNTGLPAVDPATGAPITAVDPVTGAAIP